MSYEEPQRGNPHRLTIRQHVVSVAHLSTWTLGEALEVSRPPHTHWWRDKPKNVFLVQRAWCQKTELVRFKRSIEDPFHAELTRIMSGAPLTDHYAVSRYFVLWAYRSTFLKRRADDDIVLGRVKDYAQPLSKDDEERLEKAGVQFMRPGGRVPSRFAAGIDWMRFHDRQHDQIVEQRWRVVEVPGRLLIGDTPWGPFIPVSPILALLGHQFGPRGTSPVRRLNELTLNAVQCHCARVPAAPRRRRRS